MRLLQQYAKGTPAQDLLEDDIKIFSETAKNYTFTQYLEIKEYLLTLLESYQTKVINFFETGHQDDKGKLSFQRRNTHNDLPLGDVKNHPKIKLDGHSSELVNMPLKSWK